MSGSSALLDPVCLPSADPFVAPDLLSPEGIHEYLLRAHRISNELRFKFLGALRALDEGRFFSSLGFPTMWAYAEHFFGWEKSRTYEALRVARALEDLPLTRDRFIAGLAYSRVLEITRIASRETEAEWIAFADKTTLKRLRLEVSDAKGKGRKRPRKDHYSLPAQRTRLPFDFAPEEYTILMTALRKKSAELSQSLGTEVSPKEALHQVAVEILETDPKSVAEGRVEREGAAFHILYRHCPECRRSDVETDDGPMEIAPEVIERHEPPFLAPFRAASQGPSRSAVGSSPRLQGPGGPFLEKLFVRDGRRCSNPLCRRPLDLQGNHLKRRSEGGETALHNEHALCIPCHALHTAGLLDISGNPLEGLTYTPRGVKLARALAGEKASVEAMPVVLAQPPGPAVEGARPDEGTGLTPEEGRALEDATLGLVALGCRKTDAQPRARKALAKLQAGGEKITAETLLKTALR